MPFFRITVESRPHKPVGPDFAKGAFATRWVKAISKTDGEAKVVGMLTKEYAEVCGWSSIDYQVQSADEVGFWTFIRKQPGRGSTFYLDDE
jgi:hypothetical protein